MKQGSVKSINPFVNQVIKAAARIVLAPFFRLHAEGRENIPRGAPFVLLPKHQRWQDIPLLDLASPRPLYYVAKSELFMNPLSKWFMTSLGGISLDRRRPLASRNSIKAIVILLRRGEGIVVFPEGTYYRNSMGPGHGGVIRLIHSRIEVPFIPVGIHYSQAGMRRRVDIKFGKAIRWESAEAPEAFVAAAMKEIRRLSGL